MCKNEMQFIFCNAQQTALAVLNTGRRDPDGRALQMLTVQRSHRQDGQGSMPPTAWNTFGNQRPFWLQGNVILTDGRYEVLTLLRSHRDDDRGLATMPRHPYPLHSIRLAAPVTAGGWAGALAAATDEKATFRSESGKRRCVAEGRVKRLMIGGDSEGADHQLVVMGCPVLGDWQQMQGTIVGPHCQAIALGNMLSFCVLPCEVLLDHCILHVEQQLRCRMCIGMCLPCRCACESAAVWTARRGSLPADRRPAAQPEGEASRRATTGSRLVSIELHKAP